MKWLSAALARWGPALILMGAVFFLSSQTGSSLPNFGSLDYIVKKVGHVLGYGLLALSYRRGLGEAGHGRLHAWLLAVAYAATDEFHQSFVTGRHPSAVDALGFDNLGAVVALWLEQRPWAHRA